MKQPDSVPTLATIRHELAETTSAAPKRAVVLVEDHPITRLGLRSIIDQQPDLKVVDEADNAPEALQRIARNHPDIVLIDISLKTTNGIELTKNVASVAPGLPILVLSMHAEDMYAERALRAGARGYLMKQAACEHLVSALRKVLDGEVYVSERLHGRMLQKLMHKGQKHAGLAIDSLSDREMEVFGLIGDGYGTREIALKLNLSMKTIDSYREHLKLKLNLHSSNELNRHAIEWGRSAQLG